LKIQKRYINRHTQIVPIESILNALVWNKILFSSPEASSYENVIEIGPGSGWGTFFLANTQQILKYFAIEITQPFYILQHLILKELYGYFKDLAEDEEANLDSAMRYSNQAEYEPVFLRSGSKLGYADSKQKTYHIPWRHTSSLERACGFKEVDLIIANACLNEISRPSLESYLNQFIKILKPNGTLFYFCPGHNHDGRGLISILEDKGFETVFSVFGSLNFKGRLWHFPLNCAVFQLKDRNSARRLGDSSRALNYFRDNAARTWIQNYLDSVSSEDIEPFDPEGWLAGL